VAIDVHFFNMPFAIQKSSSVSAPSSKINKQLL